MERGIALFGYVVMILLALAMSSHRRRFPWRIVIGGTLLQFLFAVFLILSPPGRWFFEQIGNFFEALLGFVDHGSKFVFGSETFQEHFFAFKILPTIIFVSSLMSILYYLGVMQKIVGAMAFVMQKTMGLSGAESLAAAANVFVGQTEAPLVIKPYVITMTRSELMALMVGGFATIAGGVMAMFIGMKIDAGHLLTASVISAPAGLLIAKILEPETEKPLTLGANKVDAKSEASNMLEAAAMGASDGLKLALNVGAMLIAFLALIAMFDAGIGMVGDLFNKDNEWSLKAIFGFVFAPIAWLMGIELKDCRGAGTLLGLKMAANEIVAYEQLSQCIATGAPFDFSPRTITIMTYALCGFSNFASIGIQIGGIGALAPERRAELSALSLRAMLGGTLACCMTGCVAGMLIP